jgi:hypothetical protein
MGRPRRIICIAYLTVHQLRNFVVTRGFFGSFYLELSHRVGQTLRAACAGDETNRDFWETEATVMRCEDQITLFVSVLATNGVSERGGASP